MMKQVAQEAALAGRRTHSHDAAATAKDTDAGANSKGEE
jgi:hypothetical protein